MFLLIWPLAAWAQEELTLDRAIALALQHNRKIRVAQIDVEKSAHAYAALRTYRLPQFNFDMINGGLITPLKFTLPAGVLGVLPGLGPAPPTPMDIVTDPQYFSIVSATAGEALSQQYKIGLGLRAERLSGLIAKEKLALEEQTIVNDVKKTYYNVVQAQSALKATDETIKLLHELERVVTNGLQEQVLLKSDLLDTQQGLAKAESQAATLRSTADTLKEKLNGLFARDLTTDFTVAAQQEVKPWELSLAETRARALEQRPELREIRLKLQQAEIDRRAKKAEYIPDVNLRVDYLSAFRLQFLPSNVATVGVEVKYDLFDWGRKKQELAGKSLVIEQAKTGVDEATQQIQVEVGLYFRKLEETRRLLRVANLELESDQEKVRVALNKYEQKVVLLKDVLQLQASMAEKTYKYQESLMSFWTARADLEKAIGER